VSAFFQLSFIKPVFIELLALVARNIGKNLCKRYIVGLLQGSNCAEQLVRHESKGILEILIL